MGHVKREMESLAVNLEAIVIIIKKYQDKGGQDAVKHRIQRFCECAETCYVDLWYVESDALLVGLSISRLRQSRTCMIVLRLPSSLDIGRTPI